MSTENSTNLYDRPNLNTKRIERNGETPGLPVANHFGDDHHDKNHIKVYGVSACRSSEKIRKDAEQYIIFRLGTLQPAGMNISFTVFKS